MSSLAPKRRNANLTPEEAAVKREIAAGHGYYQTTKGGKTTLEEGSAVKLDLAIIYGEIATVMLPEEQRDALMVWIDQHAAELDPTVADALRSVRESIADSVQREQEWERIMTTEKTFSYDDLPLDRLSATDLIEEATDPDASAYTITIEGAAERAQALYLPSEGRLGIAWGADATWADCRDVEAGIAMWLNDPEGWQAAN